LISSARAKRFFSESFLDDLDEINLQKRKLEDDLNDIYHERIRINQTEDKVDGN